MQSFRKNLPNQVKSAQHIHIPDANRPLSFTFSLFSLESNAQTSRKLILTAQQEQESRLFSNPTFKRSTFGNIIIVSTGGTVFNTAALQEAGISTTTAGITVLTHSRVLLYSRRKVGSATSTSGTKNRLFQKNSRKNHCGQTVSNRDIYRNC